MSNKERFKINFNGMISKDTLEHFIKNKDLRISIGGNI